MNTSPGTSTRPIDTWTVGAEVDSFREDDRGTGWINRGVRRPTAGAMRSDEGGVSDESGFEVLSAGGGAVFVEAGSARAESAAADSMSFADTGVRETCGGPGGVPAGVAGAERGGRGVDAASNR